MINNIIIALAVIASCLATKPTTVEESDSAATKPQRRIDRQTFYRQHRNPSHTFASTFDALSHLVGEVARQAQIEGACYRPEQAQHSPTTDIPYDLYRPETPRPDSIQNADAAEKITPDGTPNQSSAGEGK